MKWLIFEMTDFEVTHFGSTPFSMYDLSEVTHFSKCHFFEVTHYMEWHILEITPFEVTQFGGGPFFKVLVFRSYSFSQVPLFRSDASLNWPIFSSGSLLKLSPILKVIEFEVTYFTKLLTSEVTHYRTDRFQNDLLLEVTFRSDLLFRSGYNFSIPMFSNPNIVQTS